MGRPWILSLIALPTALAAQGGTTAREREIALARSAGPATVARDATVYVLGAKGYEVAVRGTNGFTCLVEHDRADTVEPVCYDAEGSTTLLPAALRRAELRSAGTPEPRIEQEIAAGFRSGKFRAPSRPGIAYMLSPEQTVFDPSRQKVIPYVPHVMFYAPHRKAADLGMAADHAEHGLPFLIFEGQPNAMVIVPVGVRSEKGEVRSGCGRASESGSQLHPDGARETAVGDADLDPEFLPRFGARWIRHVFGDEERHRLGHDNAAGLPRRRFAKQEAAPSHRLADRQLAVRHEEFDPSGSLRRAGISPVSRVNPEPHVSPAQRVVRVHRDCPGPHPRQGGPVPAEFSRHRQRNEQVDRQHREAPLSGRHEASVRADRARSRRRSRSSDQASRRNSAPPVSRLAARPSLSRTLEK